MAGGRAGPTHSSTNPFQKPGYLVHSFVCNWSDEASVRILLIYSGTFSCDIFRLCQSYTQNRQLRVTIVTCNRWFFASSCRLPARSLLQRRTQGPRFHSKRKLASASCSSGVDMECAPAAGAGFVGLSWCASLVRQLVDHLQTQDEKESPHDRPRYQPKKKQCTKETAGAMSLGCLWYKICSSKVYKQEARCTKGTVVMFPWQQHCSSVTNSFASKFCGVR